MNQTHPAFQSSSISPIEVTHEIRLLELASADIERDRSASLSAASRILRLSFCRTSTQLHVKTASLAGWQVARVRDYIDRNLHRPIHVRDLSLVAHRSIAHFSRAFKNAFGEPPHAYVVRRRLEAATHLMLTSAEPLSKIALCAGFSDQAHLSKVFKRAFGDSPASWRRERRVDGYRHEKVSPSSDDRRLVFDVRAICT
jgi:AraC family transcriptional regulator